MSDDTQVPANPLSGLLTSNKKGKKSDPAPATPALEQPTVEPAHEKSVVVEIHDLSPSAPFEVGTRVVYGGSRRLFAGWESVVLLEPGSEFVVDEVAGRFSVISSRAYGATYRMVIAADEREDWSVA